MLTVEILKKVKPDTVLHCYNPECGIDQFAIQAKVLENDKENQTLTLERRMKYGAIKCKTLKLRYDTIIKDGYEPYHPAYLPLFQYHHELIAKIPEFTTHGRKQEMGQEYVLETIVESLAEGGTPWFYEEVSMYCLRNEIKDVTDIGCCYGFQSEFFTSPYKNPIRYTGVEETDCTGYFWKEHENTYLHAKYPCELPHGTMAISHLCVGFLCTGEDVYKKLSEQFAYLALDNENEKDMIEKYFVEVYRTTRNPYIDRVCSEEERVPNMIVYKRK